MCVSQIHQKQKQQPTDTDTMHFSILLRLLIVVLLCGFPAISSADSTQEPLHESDTCKTFRTKSGRTVPEVFDLADQLGFSKHTKLLCEPSTSKNTDVSPIQQLLSLQSQFSKRLFRHRASNLLHFHSIVRTGYNLSESLDGLIYDLQRTKPDLDYPPAFEERIDEMRERVKDVEGHIEAVTKEIDELKCFFLEMLKHIEELQTTLEEWKLELN